MFLIASDEQATALVRRDGAEPRDNGGNIELVLKTATMSIEQTAGTDPRRPIRLTLCTRLVAVELVLARTS